MIGPYVCYAEIHAQAESVCQNYVLGRCVFCVQLLCYISLLYFIYFFLLKSWLWIENENIFKIGFMGDFVTQI